jgi:hypothetical protein
VPTSVAIGWIARLNSASRNPASVELTITRISGPGQHPQIVYSSKIMTKWRHTLTGQFTVRQMAARHIGPAVYSVTFKNGNVVVRIPPSSWASQGRVWHTATEQTKRTPSVTALVKLLSPPTCSYVGTRPGIGVDSVGLCGVGAGGC